MTYYRLIDEIELKDLEQKGRLEPSENLWPPYPPKTIISIFETENQTYICERYGETIADQRELKPGECLYLIKIDNPPNEVEIDKSQVGWPESRAHHGPIPIKHITITKKILFKIKGDMRKIKERTNN